MVAPPKNGAALADSAYKVARQMAKEQGDYAEATADQHFALGGSPPSIPFSERSDIRQIETADNRPPTFLAGSGPGRTDTIPTSVPSGSYILSSDVLSGLGAGNSSHGADVMNHILASKAPYGAAVPKLGRAGPGLPHAPAPYREPAISNPLSSVAHVAAGGKMPDHEGEPVEVMLAHGEMILYPHHVKHLGGGDLKRGHKVLDAFSMAVRKKTIQDLKRLPPPKQASEK